MFKKREYPNFFPNVDMICLRRTAMLYEMWLIKENTFVVIKYNQLREAKVINSNINLDRRIQNFAY
jgi:hypothetical protein